MSDAIVVIVGDEILQGHTQDTNSHYLAQRLAARGIRLRRIVAVPDTVDEISRTLEALFDEAPAYIFVCGGIGPTPDDRTYEGVAMAVGAPLEIAPADEAWMKRRMAERRYGEGLLDDPLQREGMLRMIRRPQGSAVILNPLGAALGSAAKVGRTTVFVLPGVPRELRAMMEQEIEPKFLHRHSPTAVTAELELRAEEARLWSILRELEMTERDVSIGSYPQEERGRIVLRLRGPAAAVERVAAKLATATGARRSK